MSKDNPLLKEWSYELEYWMPVFGSEPSEVIASIDKSGYEMNKATVFKLENHKYAFVWESGCSCYDPRSADIEVCASRDTAMALFKLWDNGDVY